VLYPILVHTANGLETGLYSALLLASLYCYAKFLRRNSNGNAIGFSQWVLLGIVLGLTVLARIDAAFLVIIIVGHEVYRSKRKGLVNGTIFSVFAFVISSPWWYYNYHLFGSIMPQSGMAEALGAGVLAENLRRSAIVIGDILTVFFFLPNYELPGWFHFFWLIITFVIIFWIGKKFLIRAFISEKYNISFLLPLFYFCGALIVFYIFFFCFA